MKVYTLTVITEKESEHPKVEITIYKDLVTALKAYSDTIDGVDTKGYEEIWEEDEIATAEYRWWRAFDRMGVDSVTIELEAKEVI